MPPSQSSEITPFLVQWRIRFGITTGPTDRTEISPWRITLDYPNAAVVTAVLGFHESEPPFRW
jgi:hypothetical protein